MFDPLLHGGSAKPQISNVFSFCSSLEPMSLSLSLAVASYKPFRISQERRPADSARGTAEVEEEEVRDAVNNNSQYNPVPDRCLRIEAR